MCETNPIWAGLRRLTEEIVRNEPNLPGRGRGGCRRSNAQNEPNFPRAEVLDEENRAKRSQFAGRGPAIADWRLRIAD
jgi:hypothetical protein